MKADTEQHQLRTTADGEPGGERKRRQAMLEERKDKKPSVEK